MEDKIYEKVIKKKEFSQLPKTDVELAFEKFNKNLYLDEEKIKLTRDLLRKVFSVFTSSKLLNLRDKQPEWVLRKHLSTRERLPYYTELYNKLFGGLKKKVNVFDFGAGVNGFSFSFFPSKFEIHYFGFESVGQLVSLTNNFFKKNHIKGFVFHQSLFELEKIKEKIMSVEGSKIVFLFKILDSLEMLERNYSKYLLKEIVPLVDRVVVSFATKSLIARRKFKANRGWILGFIKDNFKIVDDFKLGDERYLVIEKQ